MKNDKIVNYNEIGSVTYRRNNRARNISIRISSDGKIKVTIPAWCSFHKAESFVVGKINWINQKLLKIKRKTEENLVWGPEDKINFRNGLIVIEQGKGATIVTRRIEKQYTIILPEDFSNDKPEHREALKNHIAHIGLREAKEQLPLILSMYSERFILPFNKLTVRRMKSRWGSCSSKNNISLNSGLIFLNEDLIEYICLHELAHTVQKNHSQAFWDFLTSMLPDALSRRKELRNMTIIA